MTPNEEWILSVHLPNDELPDDLRKAMAEDAEVAA